MTPNLPTVDDAYNTLQDRVYQRIFFAKCASAGLSPTTAAEASQMMEMAGKLRAAEQIHTAKQAADGMYTRMNARLDTVLAQHGINLNTKQAEDRYSVAATALASDPLLYNSVLALKQAEADEIRRALPASK